MNTILKYGFFTHIHLLNKLEKQERFEDCKIIIDIINEFNEKYSPIEVVNFDLEDYQQEFWKKGLSGEIAKKNLWYYSEQLEKELFDTAKTIND